MYIINSSGHILVPLYAVCRFEYHLSQSYLRCNIWKLNVCYGHFIHNISFLCIYSLVCQICVLKFEQFIKLSFKFK